MFEDLHDLDDDRVYFYDLSKIRRIDDGPVFTQELLPTGDPNRYVMRITEMLPRYVFMKEAILKDN
mgnify:FL=1